MKLFADFSVTWKTRHFYIRMLNIKHKAPNFQWNIEVNRYFMCLYLPNVQINCVWKLSRTRVL